MITDKASEYIQSLESGILCALDVGSKTIGTAFCDERWSIATPHQLIKRSKFAKDKIKLQDIITQRETKGIVIGLPINLDGSESPRSQSSRAFAKNIEDLGLPILLWDERWSTQAVERAMIDNDVSRAKRAERIDNGAAAYILQGAIDALTNI